MKKSVGARTIAFPAPAWVVGSYDKEGKPNGMVAAWGGICCSKPPCIAVSLRKATYSYGNIIEKGAFTVNIPSEELIKKADYFGVVSGKSTDKFADTGLTAVKSELVDAPFIAEFPLVIECKVLHTIEIGLHTQFIGEIMDVKADENVLADDGTPAIEKVKPVIYAPASSTYHAVGAYLGKAFSIGKEL